MTAIGDHVSVLRAPLNVLVATTASLALAASGAAASGPQLPAGWSHAEVNVLVKGRPHTLIYDRGKVQSVTGAALTLRERDGILVTIPVASNATVTINGKRAVLSDVHAGATAQTKRIDGGPALLVQVEQSKAAAKRAAAAELARTKKAAAQSHGRSR
jgi:hypothetical protein